MTRAACASAISIALMMSGSALCAETFSGHPIVLDGDTVRLRGAVVGLFGIAAPGPEQTCESAAGLHHPCGSDAARALAEHVGAGEVACEARGLDRHRRAVAVCRLSGEDLSAWMVARGYAVADRLSAPDYVPQETKAWATRRGLWAGVFQEPSNRRRAEYVASPQMAALAK